MTHAKGLGAATEAGGCPPCGEVLPGPAESSPIEPASDDLIAPWLTPVGLPEPPRASDGECRACGYSGDLGTGAGRLVCPACGAEQRGDVVQAASQVTRCPACGGTIEICD